MIINAGEHPPAIALFRNEIGFQEYQCEQMSDQFAFFAAQPLPPQTSYQAFYLLWCLGLQEGRLYADQLLSVDRLSDDRAYRLDMLQRLEMMGLRDLDLSDCRIPQAVYGQEDQEFFLAQEEKIHELLLRGGWTREDLSALIALRQEHAPRCRRWAPEREEEIKLARDAERARSLARRFSARDAAFRKTAREHAQELKAEKDAIKGRYGELEVAARQLREEVAAANRELQAISGSRSWRITGPLRKVMDMVRRTKKR